MLHLHALLYQREFLSTPSARRATSPSWRCCMMSAISIHALREEGDVAVVALLHDVCNFYPRPPRGGRPTYKHVRAAATIISIHALREEGDEDALDFLFEVLGFLSTPSARRATGAV